jgi:hypothetical protein
MAKFAECSEVPNVTLKEYQGGTLVPQEGVPGIATPSLPRLLAASQWRRARNDDPHHKDGRLR